MELNKYQELADTTAFFPAKLPNIADENFLGILYCTIKLNGEAGELAEKVGKLLRDKSGIISFEDRKLLLLECGDCLWYIAELARMLKSDLEEVGAMNIQKLESRRQRNKLGGSGDER